MPTDATIRPSSGRGVKRSNRKDIREFDKKVKTLRDRGFVILSPSKVTEIPSTSSEEKLSESAKMIGGEAIQSTFGIFDNKQSKPKPVPNVGTPGLGYIPWGSDDMLPNTIFNLVSSLPYTAAAIKYIVDLTVGLGPELMYPCLKYANGTVKEVLISYKNAGVYITNRIREIRAEMAESGQNNQGNPNPGSTVSWKKAIGEEEDDEPLVGTPEFELKELLEDYERWKSTMKEYEKFVEDNNLDLHFLKCMMDDGHMGIYFPTVGLNIGRAKEEWNPKIVKVGHLPVVCSRLEEMDSKLRINYVYYSEKWRRDATMKLETKDVVAYPTLMPENMLPDIRRQVRNNRNAPTRRRPTWFCCPSYYPSMQKPYYPQPDWWSIYPCKAYNYASTLITDKATARQNSTMWGKMIFINNEYLRAMFDEKGADTPEEKEKIRDEIYNSVNNFLKVRENNGKTICLDMFIGPDGKTMQHAVEIVDVPQISNSKEMKDELEEISSIIFFAIGVHPALIGAVPGKSSSSGGTFQRELHLLKQTQVSPRQRIYLKWLQSIHSFNQWDKKGVWVIKQPVLTTLDRNSTGTEETESK